MWAAALLTAAFFVAPLSAQFSLSTGFTGTTSFDGNFFDVVSINGINVQTMDIHLAAGTHTVEVWAVTGGGTHQGKEANSALWTMVAQVVGLTSAGNNLPTPLGATLNVTIPPGTTQGFYVTVTTGGDVRYQVGTTIGSVAASDANMQILEGNYGTYPFSPFATSARRWNGTIYYNLLSNFADDLFLQTITAPSSPAVGCAALSINETVTMQLFNLGSNSIPSGTNIPVSYSIAYGAGTPTVVNETIVTGAAIPQFGGLSYSFTTTADLSVPGPYTIIATASLAGDQDASNDSKTKLVSSGGNFLVTSFPFIENFDGSASNGTLVPPAGWFQETTDSTGTNSDWFFRNQLTPTTACSPAADHTTGVLGQGYYAHVEDASSFAAISLRTPCMWIALIANPELEFWVHSLNANTGGASPNSLSVDVIDQAGNVTSDIITPIGALAAGWQRVRVSLVPYVGLGIIQIRFRGRSDGGSASHDIAIDDVRVIDAFADDLTVAAITNPVTNANCGPQGFPEVTISVLNDGTTTYPAGTMIPVSYTVNGGAPVNETMTLTGNLTTGNSESFTFAANADLSAYGTYTLTATVSSPTDQNTANDTKSGHVVLSGPPGAAVISTFPWLETFDASVANNTTIPPANWIQATNDATGTNSDWFFRNTDTPSTGTGPVADHTTGVSGVGYFAHVEDAGNFAAVNLITPCIDISALPNPTLAFWVHSLNGNSGGGSPNLLNVDVIDDQGGITTSVIPAIGALGNVWTEFLVDLTPFQSIGTGRIRIQFRGTSAGGSTLHDVCIDDVRVFETLTVDLEMLSIDSPASTIDCVPIGVSTVTVTIRNVGGLTLGAGNPVQVSYAVDGGVPVIETFSLPINLAPTQTVQLSFATTYNFANIATYLLDATVLFGDQNPANDAITGLAIESGANPQIAPWSENFDSILTVGGTVGGTVGPAGWINDQADATGGSGTAETDWRFRNNDTSSTGTGAAADHTTGVTGQGFYAYVEDSSGHWLDVNLLTPCVDLSALVNPCMNFWIHSQNAEEPSTVSQNFLHIDVITYPGAVVTQDVIPPIGQLDANWNQIIVPLTAYVGQTIKVRFRCDSSNSGTNDFNQDICIDDVSFEECPNFGTGEDFQLRTFINGAGTGEDFTKTAVGGDLLTTQLASDGGAFWGFPPVLLGQLYADGAAPAPSGLLPAIHVNLQAVIIFDGNVPTPFGPVLIGPGGVNLSFLLPPGLAPFGIRIQGIISSPFVANGIYASTDAHDIDLQ